MENPLPVCWLNPVRISMPTRVQLQNLTMRKYLANAVSPVHVVFGGQSNRKTGCKSASSTTTGWRRLVYADCWKKKMTCPSNRHERSAHSGQRRSGIPAGDGVLPDAQGAGVAVVAVRAR